MMKRKACTEFKPPQLRSVKARGLNSTEIITPGETSGLKSTEGNQIAAFQSESGNSEEPGFALLQCTESSTEKYPNHQENDLIPSDMMIIKESAEVQDIKCKPALERGPEGTNGREIETQDTSSIEPQTFHVAQSSLRYSSDETGEEKACRDVKEDKTKLPGPKTKRTHQEEVSGETVVLLEHDLGETRSHATDKTEFMKPPPQKRLRRRMGMFGLGDRKRRSLLEGQHSRQEGAKTASKESRGGLRINSVPENRGCVFMDEGMMEQVVLQQGLSSRPVISDGASLCGQEEPEIKDQPSRLAVTNYCDREMATSYGVPPLNGANCEGQDMEITNKHKDLREDEGYVDVTRDREMTESRITEEISENSVVTDEICEGSKTATECLVEIVKEVSYGTIGLASELGKHPVIEAVVFGLLNIGVTNEVSEGSKETSKCLADVTDEVSHGATGLTKESYESFKETSVHTVTDAVSFGLLDVGVTDEVCEGSKETPECLVEVAEEVSHGPIGLHNEIFEDCEETSKRPVKVAEEVSYDAIGRTTEVCEGPKETAEHPVALEASHGSIDVTDEICKRRKEATQCPDAAEETVNYGSPGVIDEVCEGSTEGPIAAEVSDSSTGVNDEMYEGSKEATESTVVAEEGYGPIGVTDLVCESYEKATQDPWAAEEAVGCGCSGVINEVSEGSKGPVAAEVSYSSTGVNDEIYEVPKEATKSTVVAEEGCDSVGIRAVGCGTSVGLQAGGCGSTGLIEEVSEGSKGLGDAEVSYSSTGVNVEIYAVPKQVTESSVAEEGYDSVGISDEVCKIEPTELMVEGPEEVKNGSTITDGTTEFCEGSKELTEAPVEVNNGFIVVAVEVAESSKETTEHPVKVAEEVDNGFTEVTNKICEGFKEQAKVLVEVSEELNNSSTGVTNVFFEGSKETNEHLVEVPEEVNKGSTMVEEVVYEDSKETTELLVEVPEEVNKGSTSVAEEVYEGTKETNEVLVEVPEEVSKGSTTVAEEVYEESTELLVEVPKEVNKGSTSVAEEVYEDYKESTELLVPEEVDNGFTGVTKEGYEGSEEPTELPVEEMNCGSVIVTGVCESSKELNEGEVEVPTQVSCGFVGVASDVSEGSIAVSMEIQESVIALEQSEMEMEVPCRPHDTATAEHDLNGPENTLTDIEMKTVFMEQMVTKLAFSETLDTKSQSEHTDLPQTPTTAGPGNTDPAGETAEELSVSAAPPTGQEKHMHCACDPSVIPAVVKQPVSNPTQTPAATGFPQDHDNIPLSLYSVTDSQLNNIALSMELDDEPLPEGFVHQEDATEFVCGLIKELSSLNRTVMGAHREMELMRRGNRPPKAPIRRSYGPCNTQM